MSNIINSKRLVTAFSLVATNLFSSIPTSPQSITLPQPSINLSTHTLHFLVPGASDITNVIEYTPSLTSPAWRSITNLTGGSLFTDNMTDARRFYRAETITPPGPTNAAAAQSIIYTNGPNAGGPYDITQNYGNDSITLGWYPLSDTNIIGYKISFGPESQVYTKSAIVGNVDQVTITDLNRSIKNYFVISSLTATDTGTYSPELTAPILNPSSISNAPAL